MSDIGLICKIFEILGVGFLEKVDNAFPSISLELLLLLVHRQSISLGF